MVAKLVPVLKAILPLIGISFGIAVIWAIYTEYTRAVLRDLTRIGQSAEDRYKGLVSLRAEVVKQPNLGGSGYD